MRPRALALALVATLLAAGCAALTPGEAPRPYYTDVLAGAPFTRLIIEVDHAPGREPGEAAMTHLLSTFRNITTKTEVEVVMAASLDDAAETWTAKKLLALEIETRNTTHAVPVAVLHVLYPAGQYENPGVAGVTIGGPVLGPAVVFLDTIREYPVGIGGTGIGNAPLPEEAVRIVERSTVVHEAGHAIGLVDNGLAMVCPHEDEAHEAHSANTGSIMYYAVDSLEGVRQFLTQEGRIPDKFDANDLRDIQAAGGRGMPPPAAC